MGTKLPMFKWYREKEAPAKYIERKNQGYMKGKLGEKMVSCKPSDIIALRKKDEDGTHLYHLT